MKVPSYEKFREMLDAKNMTDYAFSEQTGIPYTTINRWKHGEGGMTVETLSKIVDALDAEYEDFLVEAVETTT